MPDVTSCRDPDWEFWHSLSEFFFYCHLVDTIKYHLFCNCLFFCFSQPSFASNKYALIIFLWIVGTFLNHSVCLCLKQHTHARTHSYNRDADNTRCRLPRYLASWYQAFAAGWRGKARKGKKDKEKSSLHACAAALSLIWLHKLRLTFGWSLCACVRVCFRIRACSTLRQWLSSWWR